MFMIEILPAIWCQQQTHWPLSHWKTLLSKRLVSFADGNMFGKYCLVLLRVKAPCWFVVSQAHRRCLQTSPRGAARNNKGWWVGRTFHRQAGWQRRWDPLLTPRCGCRAAVAALPWHGEGRVVPVWGTCAACQSHVAWRKSSVCPKSGNTEHPSSGTHHLPGLPHHGCLQIGLFYQVK